MLLIILLFTQSVKASQFPRVLKYYNKIQMFKHLLKQMFQAIHQKVNRKLKVASLDNFCGKT